MGGAKRSWFSSRNTQGPAMSEEITHSCGELDTRETRNLKKQCKVCGVLQSKGPQLPLLPSTFSVVPLLGQINLKAMHRGTNWVQISFLEQTRGQGTGE